MMIIVLLETQGAIYSTEHLIKTILNDNYSIWAFIKTSQAANVVNTTYMDVYGNI